MQKKKLSLLLAVLLLLAPFSLFPTFSSSAAEYHTEINCKSLVLMEAETGKVLYEKNSEEAFPPASVTKVMTMLLIMESIDNGKIALSDRVVTSERAAEMGGSQIFLKVGEEMSVEDLLKSIVMASANDAAVAMAEHIAGSETGFVEMMNARAEELGMKNTRFENTNGLDDTAENHVTSARDIAIMTRELLTHPKILDYTTLWQDSIRDGAFVLTNTNRLVRYYSGANGMKTGSTAKAGFCISATASRDGMQLIAVVMGADSRDDRNELARSLLDYGFANFAVYRYEGGSSDSVRVTGGVSDLMATETAPFCTVVKKGEEKRVEAVAALPESVMAPIAEHTEIGHMQFLLNGDILGEIPILAAAPIEKISFFTYFIRLAKQILFFRM